MYDFDALVAEMESNNLALEALIADVDQMDCATEGLFSKPKTVDQMLANVKKTIDKKCKTPEDCEDWLAKIKNEEEKFNTAIKSLQEATKKYQEDGDKKALKDTCKPILKNLKKTCDILSMKDISEDAENITEEELKKLRDFLVGAKEIIANKAAEFGASDECGTGSCESFLEMLQGMSPAEESFERTKIVANNVLIKLQTKLVKMAEWLEKRYALKRQQAPEGSKQEKRAKYWEQVFRTWKSKLNFKIADKDAKIEKYKADLDKIKEGLDKDKEAAEKESMTWENEDFKANSGEEAFIDAQIQSESYAIEAAFSYYNELEYQLSVATEGTANVVASVTLAGIITAICCAVDPDSKQKTRIKLGETSKQLRATMKEAKKCARTKDYDKAIALYNKAIKGYQGLLALANKIPDKVSVHKNLDGSDTNKGIAKVDAINWCNSKISRCQAAIQAIKDKQIKAERKAASESYIDMDDVDDVLESMLSDLNEPVMESLDDEDPLSGLDFLMED